MVGVGVGIVERVDVGVGRTMGVGDGLGASVGVEVARPPQDANSRAETIRAANNATIVILPRFILARPGVLTATGFVVLFPLRGSTKCLDCLFDLKEPLNKACNNSNRGKNPLRFRRRINPLPPTGRALARVCQRKH